MAARKTSRQKKVKPETEPVRPPIPQTPAGRRLAFLMEYEARGSLTAAATAAGIVRRTHYDWLEKDPEYVRDFAAAKARAIESLETVAFERAFDGSDLLLIFLLKAANPAKYRDKYEPARAPQDDDRDNASHGLTIEPPSGDLGVAASNRKPN